MSAHQFMWNAHDICNTRLCAASNCPDDAMTGYGLCERHTRQQAVGRTVPLHVTPEAEGPTLRCSSCHQWKPDEAFTMRSRPPSKSGPKVDRRGRCSECRECSARRRRTARANLTADLLAELRAYDSARKRRATS